MMFTCKIRLGNAAMLEPYDVGAVLRRIAERLDDRDFVPGAAASVVDERRRSVKSASGGL